MALTDAEIERLKGYMPAEFRDSDRLAVWIEGASFRVSRCIFGDAYIYALSLVVAHKAAMEDRGTDGAAGRVTSKREGDISISYGSATNGTDGDLSATSYGQEYLSLLSQYAPRPGITGFAPLQGFDGGHCL